MHELSNAELKVDILDPLEDATRFGPRYCTGGYIFQVEDANMGPILTGPTYPEDFNWFDGQGIPDAFHLGALREPGATASESLVPGIGVCDMGQREVLEYCSWRVTRSDAEIELATEQELGPFAFSLRRLVRLSGRVVRSETTIENRGRAQVPICWFPHPFFPYGNEGAGGAGPLCRLPGPVSYQQGRGYTVAADGYFRCSDWKAGGALPVTCNEGGPLTILYRHPDLGLIAASFSFAAGHVLLWGNDNTFSFEPYLERTIGIGRSLDWWAEYHL